MNGAQLLPVFVVGLAGSIHCAGMCGGIVTAISATAPKPIAVIPPTRNDVAYVLSYNAGRISSYMLAGALADLKRVQAQQERIG